MDTSRSKVYVLTDEDGRITRIDGGFTVGNIRNFTGWVLIDEGTGDRYNLCQGNYLPGPLTDERGIYRYKLVDGSVVERTQEEMDKDYAPTEETPTHLDRIEAQALYTALMTDTLIEEV